MCTVKVCSARGRLLVCGMLPGGGRGSAEHARRVKRGNASKLRITHTSATDLVLPSTSSSKSGVSFEQDDQVDVDEP